MNSHLITGVAAGLTASLCTAVLFLALDARADGDETTDDVPRVVPYNGYLEHDGVPVTGTVDMRFRILDEGIEYFREDLAVQVYAGQFNVVLGAGGGLDAVIANADALELQIILLNDTGDDMDDVTLAGTQAITPVPYAMWSAESADLRVYDTLTVDGFTQINDNFDVNGQVWVDASADVSPGGDGLLTLRDGTTQISIDGNEIMATTDGAVSTLYLNNEGGTTQLGGNLDVNGTAYTGNIVMDDDADISGVDLITGHNDIRLSGDASGGPDVIIAANGNVSGISAVTGSCTWRYSSYNSRGDTQYFDRHNGVACSTNEYMRDWRVQTSGDNFRLGFYCCTITIQ